MPTVTVSCGAVSNCYKSNALACTTRTNGGNSAAIYKSSANSINFYLSYCVITTNFLLINKLIVQFSFTCKLYFIEDILFLKFCNLYRLPLNACHQKQYSTHFMLVIYRKNIDLKNKSILNLSIKYALFKHFSNNFMEKIIFIQ